MVVDCRTTGMHCIITVLPKNKDITLLVYYMSMYLCLLLWVMAEMAVNNI